MKKLSILLSISVLLVSLFFVGCKQEAPKQIPPTFKVKQIEPATGELLLYFPTTIESSQVIEVRPKVEGYLDKIYVKEGSSVRAGESLFLINPDDFRQKLLAAEADVLVAQSNLDNARLEVEKVTPLVNQAIVSEYQLKSAKSALQAAEAKLAQAKAAAEQARINLSYAHIRASASGTISQINVDEGALIRVSDPNPLTTISADGDVVAYFAISEKFINPKENKKIVLPDAQLALSNGSIYEEKGKLELASGLVNSQTGTILLKAIFPNQKKWLRTGQSGNVVIPITIPDAILIPKAATYEMLNKIMVVLVDENNTTSSKEISVIGSDADNYIINDGVEAGDLIAIEGVRKLSDGMVITPEKTN